MIEVEAQDLGGLNMLNADVVFFDPAGVGTPLATEMVKSVVVNIVLGALVIEVDLLFAM